MAPQTTKFSIKPPMTMKDPRQEYSWISQSVSGAKMNVPMPDPATAIPKNIEKNTFQKTAIPKNIEKTHFKRYSIFKDSEHKLC